MNIRCSCHITIFNMTNVFRFFKQKNQSQQENETKCPAAVDLQHLKVKEQDINLTKSYCITISIQKISSIDKFILKIHQTFRSHELKLLIQLIAFLNLYHHVKSQFIPSMHFRDQSILNFHNQTGHNYFWLGQPKKI